MRRVKRWVCALALVLPVGAAAEGIPSGQPVILWEIVWERVEGSGTQAVLRFIAPDLGQGVDAGAAQADMDWLCATHGLPVAALPAAAADEIVINLMDRAVPRGATDPDATQLFGLYSVENGECLPQVY